MAEKQYLSYKGLQDVAGHVNTRLKTVTTIPASADDGAVRLYVGETGVTYKKGHIYQYNATDLEWVDITGSTEYTAGNGIDITNDEISVETYIFTGTQAQWDALTTEQKKEYDICNITDDSSSDDEIYTKSEIDAMLGTAASKDYTDVVRPNNHDLVESNAVYSAINNALSSIYTPRGDLTCAELTSALLIEENVGNVYQMTDSGTTSALFINGAGRTININDNVGIIKAGQDTYLFNLMGNAFDLHDYQKKDLETAIESETTVEGALGALSDNKQAKTLTTSVESETTVEGALDALSTNKATQSEVNDMNNVLGAKNWLSLANVVAGANITTITNNGANINVKQTTADAWARFAVKIDVNPNTNYILSTNIDYVSGCARIAICNASESANIYESGNMREDTNFSHVFNTLDNKQVVIRFFCTTTPAETGESNFNNAMIRLVSDPDNTYVPYAPTNAKLNEEKMSYADNSILGAKNLLSYPFYETTKTVNGITFTDNGDGTITVNGTAEDDAHFGLTPVKTNNPYNGLILTGNISNPSIPTYYVRDRVSNNGAFVSAFVDIGNGVTIQSVDASYGHQLQIVIKGGNTVSNLVVKPMIRLASDPDSTYQPYAMTNKDLTDKIIKSGTITSAINANGYLNTTLQQSVNVISVISQNNSQTARFVVADDGGRYAIQILNGTSNTPVTSGTATVIYYYI